MNPPTLTSRNETLVEVQQSIVTVAMDPVYSMINSPFLGISDNAFDQHEQLARCTGRPHDSPLYSLSMTMIFDMRQNPPANDVTSTHWRHAFFDSDLANEHLFSDV